MCILRFSKFFKRILLNACTRDSVKFMRIHFPEQNKLKQIDNREKQTIFLFKHYCDI